MLPRHADAYLLLGAEPGQALEVSKPGRPAWMDTVGKAEGPFTRGGLFPVGFEVHPRFDVVCVIASRRGQQSASVRNPLPPNSDVLAAGTAALAAWSAAFGADVHVPEAARELWQDRSAVAVRALAGQGFSRLEAAKVLGVSDRLVDRILGNDADQERTA